MSKETGLGMPLIVVVALVLAMCIILAAGCSQVEYSSDHHVNDPQINCTLINYQGHLAKWCCGGEHCTIKE